MYFVFTCYYICVVLGIVIARNKELVFFLALSSDFYKLFTLFAEYCETKEPLTFSRQKTKILLFYSSITFCKAEVFENFVVPFLKRSVIVLF